MTQQATDTTKRKRRVMRSLKIEELSAVDRPAQEGARVVLMKRAAADLPASLRDVGGEPILPGVDDDTPEERDAIRLHNVRVRDRAEREAAARLGRPPMSLRDLDTILEGMAEEQRQPGEAMHAAYSRLAGDRDSDFAALLAERDRVEQGGP
ncbi:MAG: hypothetical protein OZ948_15485 [Deltaproteobacteria bacterium]|nr:hypothetical protein [Deltaproteobacteria bacterium]